MSDYVYDDDDDDGDELGAGWVAFAGVILLLLALLNGVEGIAAITSSQFFGRGSMIIGDLEMWGWVLVCIATAQLLVAPWIWMSIPAANVIGAASAAINAVVQLLFIPAYPFWSLAIFALDMLVIYALVVHGGISPRSDDATVRARTSVVP